ncbi:MAG TPA: 4Fe-4S dicluster domain-containing protein [Gammaproteobacteria bacterium]|jgi:reductive dehalogenase|nr:reductive dehalogenase [Gammaproteobacteria bacterium]HIN90794.1 4Fe-4S dicluster domain-containing protein [Porticoccaceae bacterium]HAT27096.1 reductive dehalogenase [Gammaproteobacteria bacterium]HIA59476.1 4Fe-4S dicluster domain-containing protein [Gammaproteobacteria bacterium]HIF86793.1 4Fe-4S dicluster domain-containing protein [Gammaproteobacteria bacterium]
MSKQNRHSKPIDQLTGIQVSDEFQRFDQRDEIYCRSEWDEEIQSDQATAFFEGYFMPAARTRRSDGFSQRDYALRNASWHVTNVLRDLRRQKDGRKEGFFDHFTAHEEGWSEPYAFESAEEATANIRRVAKLAGADLIGICAYDERWMYNTLFCDNSKDSKPLDLPEGLDNVILIGEAMDIALTGTVPSALSGSATGLGYSFDAVTLLTLAQYIRNLGYRAYATMNDTALTIPLALQAGLGEVGRHSLLITPEYGPRLRLGKIFTDVPLLHDKPRSYGIKQFCDVCERCASACPPKAIPFAKPSEKTYNRSNIIGINKWTTDAEKCFSFWANQNTDCSICIRVCPYNRDFSRWYHRLWFKLASSPLRRFALWLDDRLMDRRRQNSRAWWNG